MGTTHSKAEAFSVVSTLDETFSSTEEESEYSEQEEDELTTNNCSFSLNFCNPHRNADPVLRLHKASSPPRKQRKSFWSIHQEEEEKKQEYDGSCVMPSSSSWSNLVESEWSYFTQDELNLVNGEEPTAASDLRPSFESVRSFHVVTTAALPWMTGTAVNPLLRAAHLVKMNRPFTSSSQPGTVTLVVPWLEDPNDRCKAYGASWKCKTQRDQDMYIRTWLAETAGLQEESLLLKIQFYNARWHTTMNSIFAMGDICASLPMDGDVCILEEPEHLNWYRAPGKSSWTEQFRHVVGIGHTNYKAYVAEQFIPLTPVVATISSWMVRAYCHKLIKLSSVLQTYAPEKEVVANVHGIRQDFLDLGQVSIHQKFKEMEGIYFIGKLLWAKGLDRMLDLQMHFKKRTGKYFEMDIVGSGPEREEIERAFRGNKAAPIPTTVQTTTTNASGTTPPSSSLRLPRSRYEFRKDAIPAHFVGRRDHAACRNYKIFVNPSQTEVLCTTTAEAIAMNKFVLCPAHPSNAFFKQFPNCLQYHNKREFVTLLQYALSHPPAPLTEELRHTLTWEAATERCLEASAISQREAMRRERIGKTKQDAKIAKLHYELGKGYKGDVIRKVLGGGPVSDQVQYEKQASSLSSSSSGAAAVPVQ